MRTDDASDALLIAGCGLMAVVALSAAIVVPQAGLAMACCSPVGLFVVLRSMVRVDGRLTWLRALRAHTRWLDRGSLDEDSLPSIPLRLADADDGRSLGAFALCEPADEGAGSYRTIDRPKVWALIPRDIQPSWAAWLKSWYWPSELAQLRGIAIGAAAVTLVLSCIGIVRILR